MLWENLLVLVADDYEQDGFLLLFDNHFDASLHHPDFPSHPHPPSLYLSGQQEPEPLGRPRMETEFVLAVHLEEEKLYLLRRRQSNPCGWDLLEEEDEEEGAHE